MQSFMDVLGCPLSGRRYLWIACCAVFGSSAVTMAADAPPLILEHLTTVDGLPQGTVMTTLQDSQGFIWLATEDGLVRYDGHELARYAYSRNAPDGLPGNFAYQIIEDAHGDLWVALKDAGVARWNRASDTFTAFHHEPKNRDSLSSDAVRTLLVGPQGQIWIGTSDNGLDILDPVSGRATHLQHNPADPTSLIDDQVFTLALDRSGQMWVGTGKGLDRWDASNNSFVHFGHDPSDPHSLSGSQISVLRQDPGDGLWVGTIDGGLDRIGRDGRVARVFRHDPQQPASLVSDDVRAILEDQAGHLWVGTSEGLDLVDRTTGLTTHYHEDPSDAESLRDSYIMSLYEDQSGLVWIGTRSGGVSRWNPHSWELGGHRPQWLSGKVVTSFADATGSKVWMGSLGGGLTLFDGDTGQATSIDALLNKPNALGDKRVMSLLRDRRGDLWIGTMTNGLFVLRASGQLESIPVKLDDPHGISAPGVRALFESRSGAIWIGTHGGGVNVLDPATRLVRQLPFGTSPYTGAIGFPHISAFAEDSHGSIWIGTDGGGLGLARPDGSIIRVFRHNPKDPRTLPANTVFALAVDSKDRVWVGTDGGGLAQVIGSPASAETIHFRVMTRDQGLSSDTVYGVVPDSYGRIWLSGNSGLVRYDPDSGAIKTFHRQHGLQGEEFDFNAYNRLHDGRLCFGGPGGFNIFNPARVTENRNPPRLALTRVSIMGVPVSTERPTWLLDHVNLDFRANVLTLDFGALDFTSPKLNRIAYRMSGLTDRWIDIGSQHHVTLTNLEAGDHILEVRAANADSVWSQVPLRLRIHRDPAPWRSPWAYATYMLFLLSFILFRIYAQRSRFQSVINEQKRLEASSQALERLAYFDTLTGLPNRQWCMETAEAMFSEARVTQEAVAVLYLDLNSFKRVNDTFGHSVGDGVLQIVAGKLEQTLQAAKAAHRHVALARFGGDEFVALLRHTDAGAIAARVAQALCGAFEAPIAYKGLEFYSAPSIGLAVFPRDGDDVTTVLKNADTAMYHAKGGSTGAIAIYSAAMSTRQRDWLDLEARLRHAVHDDILRLHYQPKFRLRDNQMVGVEALLRWYDSEHGEISPARFIEIAEDSGLIIDIGNWVVRAACRQLRKWMDRGYPIAIAINVSPKELLHGDPARAIEAEAAAAGVPTSLIEIEITESLLVRDSATVQSALERLRELGCQIALDDFGTGYSSLAYITRFPPDRIKIDKAFVHKVDQSASDAAIANAILSLGESLNLTVTAEGVEREGQLEWLRSRGCHEAQGFLLSRPLSAADLEHRFLDRSLASLPTASL
jgi:diguanylate cyclase (GGDEF)-like protein